METYIHFVPPFLMSGIAKAVASSQISNLRNQLIIPGHEPETLC